MDFLNEEAVKEIGLTPEQVTALTPKITDYISDQKKEWDGKANENAEKIISGAAESVAKKYGFQEQRNNGEKAADYFQRVSEKAFENQKSALTKAQEEYNQKLKDFKGDEATRGELEKAKQELDNAKKQLAEFDSLKEKAEKYESTAQQLTDYKRRAAFGEVRPIFKKDANEYEVNGKWSDFQKRIEEKYNIELVDKDYIAIDKENPYKQFKLSELVQKDEELKTITGEREIAGSGASGKNLKIDGFEVEVPEEVKTNVQKRTQVVREQIAKKHPEVSFYSQEYTRLFEKYTKEITEKK